MKVRIVRRPAGAVVAGVLLIGALALPAAALADTIGGAAIPPAASRDATITIRSAQVVAKVVARVAIDYTCQPFESFDWDTGQTIETTAGSVEDGQVVIVQAQGRSIASGVGLVSGTVTCDGATVNHLSADVVATTLPWKNGSAAVGAAVMASDTTSFQDSDYASTGALVTRLAAR